MATCLPKRRPNRHWNRRAVRRSNPEANMSKIRDSNWLTSIYPSKTKMQRINQSESTGVTQQATTSDNQSTSNPILIGSNHWRQRGIPECNLLVAQRLTKYPLLIEQLIKTSKGKLELWKCHVSLLSCFSKSSHDSPSYIQIGSDLNCFN